MAGIGELGLAPTDPKDTYLNDGRYVRTWIGWKWDIAEDTFGYFHLYRKGNWVLNVQSFDLALAIVADGGQAREK